MTLTGCIFCEVHSQIIITLIYIYCPLTFITNVTGASVVVKTLHPPRIITGDSRVTWLAVTMGTRVDEHKDVQGKLPAEVTGGVLQSDVIRQLTGKISRNVQGHDLALDLWRCRSERGEVHAPLKLLVASDHVSLYKNSWKPRPYELISF
jgi:hypothetical protein